MDTSIPNAWKSEHWLQSIMNKYEAGTIVTDLHLKILKWNAAAERFFPQQNSSLEHKNVIDVLQPTTHNNIFLYRQLRWLIEKGFLDDDIVIKGPNGKSLLLMCYRQQLSGADASSIIVITIHELTEEVRNERGRKIMYRHFMNASPNPAWISDDEGRMLFMNDLALQIWKISDGYQYKHMYELFPVQVADEFLNSDRQVFDTGQSIIQVGQSFRKDGSPGIYMMHKFLLPGPYGKRLVAGESIDITEEKNAQEAVVKGLEERKRLQAELLEQRAREQQQVNQAMIIAQDRERNELAKELHDNVNQLLSSASILLSAVSTGDPEGEPLLEKSKEYITTVIQEIRKISRSLNTSTITEVGLIEPVADIVSNLRDNRGLAVDFTCDEEVEDILSPEQQLAIYRIIQEQTNNIVKHAEADKVVIGLQCREDIIHLIIQDNGKGFDMEEPRQGIGLVTMRNRAENLCGSLQVQSSPGNGFVLEVFIPLIVIN